ncbi:MAG TPA: carboxyl transferase domain-containing protein [Acidimicrobiales bacterium]|nr:carboxyl transferase domain-containing protein [Acidimicrobiales bacterium]
MTSDWRATLDELAARRRRALQMGGEERRARHRAAGKLDARARLDHLLDPGSFTEIGSLVGAVPADALVAGWGTIEGRAVMVGAEDFTVEGGSIGSGNNAKRYRLAELALADRIPLVMLLEGAGYRTTERVRGRSPTDLLAQVRCSGKVPVVTAVLGPSAGHGALVAPISDFSVMTAGAAIFTAGPPVVAEATGEQVSKEELGGPAVALTSGLVHNLAADDADALDQVRRYLSFFGSSAWSYPSSRPATASLELGDELLHVIPRDGRRTYDMRDVLSLVLDDGDWMEVQEHFGRSVICALAHLDGHPVAVVANQPNVFAGSIDAAAAEKAAHFITVADAFHLPLVFLADNPGILPGRRSESEAVLRRGARMFVAQTLARTPKLHVTFRKAYGFGSMVMAMVSFDGQAGAFAFPGATLGAMGAGAAGRAIGADDEQTRALREAELVASFSSAETFGFDELVDPRQVRRLLAVTLGRSLARRQAPAEPATRTAIDP